MFLKFSFIYLSILFTVTACIHKEDNTVQNTTSVKTQSEDSCGKIGEELVISGGSPGHWTFTKSCCSGLSSIGHPEDAMKGAAPGRTICAACGDGKCDPKLENSFNCGDCK